MPIETFTRTSQNNIDKQYYAHCCLALGYLAGNICQIDFVNDFALARQVVRNSGHKGKQPENEAVVARMNSIRGLDESASFGVTETKVTRLTKSQISNTFHLKYINRLLDYHYNNRLKAADKECANKLISRDIYCPYDNNPLYGFVHLETGIIFGAQNSPGLENIKVQMNLANKYLQLGIQSKEEEVIISNLGYFIRAMSFAHPYPFVNYSITMLFVNAVLINKFGVIIPHGNLDTQLCYVKEEDAVKIFREHLIKHRKEINPDKFQGEYKRILYTSFEG